MVTRFKLIIVEDEWTPLIKTLGSRKVQKAIGDAGNEICHNVKRALRTASRWVSITKSIQVERKGNQNKVNVARKGIFLDSMKPHYVPLRRGTKMTKWVKKHYPLTPNPMARGKLRPQRIYHGPRGGLKGAIWVRPSPWIDNPLRRSIRSTRRIVNRHISNLIKQSKVGG